LADSPAVPLTLEGSWVLHQMFRWRSGAWRSLDTSDRERIVEELAQWLKPLDAPHSEGHPNQSAAYSVIGHKADLLLIHFRDSLHDLHQAELAVANLPLAQYLEPAHSYVSVVELGLYDSSVKAYEDLSSRDIRAHTPEWDQGIAEVLARQSAAMAPRLYPEIPPARYLCFYPMDRKRDGHNNWYQRPMAERQRLMHEHGLVGRRYAGCVKQIITGSIGFDDWEWGVDLFADDPLIFKKLIYEMRFDEVSAVYALFGQFWLAERVLASDLPRY